MRDQVVVLGAAAADQLGITSGRSSSPTIMIGDDSCAVIGIISTAERRSELLRHQSSCPTVRRAAGWG
ncbi:MAG: hypothetical protein IPN02_10000 [Candidatus Microthrix sp.]|uniref:Uncharacterized protein n=1 Tax=Candidatus Neomicrothrix subdominans TaxID=2954438 RepID=A0A936TDA6_9ACTN|nr:hypothetical protein [Candidatus Microthrix subdominans]